MITALFSTTIQAPAKRVWDLITDYAGYARIPGIQGARVLEPSKEHPAGVGALREVRVDGITFVERIVEFEPESCLGYRIEESRPLPLVHEIGRMRLLRRGEAVELEWTTTFTIGVPLVGDLLARVVRIPLGRTFRGGLAWIKTEAERV